jgi:RNA polymerase sigma-70 factor (TIGR02943 family)
MNTLNTTNWVKLYADYLLRYAMFRINDKILCEDLVQETFLSALKAKDNFKGNSSEKTWLISILKNKIIDEYRKKSKSMPSINDLEEEEIADARFFEKVPMNDYNWKKDQSPQDWSPNIEDKIIHKEYLQILRLCIGKLNATQIGILQAKYFEEENSETICKDFNISKSNYWVLVHRINLSLRKCIETNWFSK